MLNQATLNEEQTDSLSDLLVRIIDSAEGYKTSADAAKNTVFESMFERRARQREQFANEIRGCLAENGVTDTQTESSGLARMHQMFVELRAKLGGKDEAVFKEIVRGETDLVEFYEEALEDVPSTSKAYSIISRQLASVRADLQDAKHKADMLD